MTAATLTPSATAADLLEELRQLLGRHDGASTLDEVRELADELSTVLRRTRGRIKRLARQERPAAEAESKAPAPPGAEAKPAAVEPPAEARAAAPQTERPARPRPTFAAPLPPPDPVVIEIRPDRPLPDPAPAPPAAETPAAAPARRTVPGVVGVVLAVLVVLWGVATAPICWVAAVAWNAGRRAVAAAGPYARRARAAGRRELDRWLW